MYLATRNGVRGAIARARKKTKPAKAPARRSIPRFAGSTDALCRRRPFAATGIKSSTVSLISGMRQLTTRNNAANYYIILLVVISLPPTIAPNRSATAGQEGRCVARWTGIGHGRGARAFESKVTRYSPIPSTFVVYGKSERERERPLER